MYGGWVLKCCLNIKNDYYDEVDQFYKMLNGRDMTYEDCEHLPFMSR